VQTLAGWFARSRINDMPAMTPSAWVMPRSIALRSPRLAAAIPKRVSVDFGRLSFVL
jgi:hypothetical protein